MGRTNPFGPAPAVVLSTAPCAPAAVPLVFCPLADPELLAWNALLAPPDEATKRGVGVLLVARDCFDELLWLSAWPCQRGAGFAEVRAERRVKSVKVVYCIFVWTVKASSKYKVVCEATIVCKKFYPFSETTIDTEKISSNRLPKPNPQPLLMRIHALQIQPLPKRHTPLRHA